MNLKNKPYPLLQNFKFDTLSLSLIIIGFFLFFLGGHHLFSPDEGRYAEIAREMLTSGNYLTPHLNGIVFLDKPILFYWLESFAFYLFGVSEWSARLFPALIGVLGCVMTYISGRILFNRRTGFFAALILATSPLYYLLAHYVNVDLEVATFISMALFSFMLVVQTIQEKSNRTFYLWLFYIALGLGVLTKGLIGIVLPGIVIGTWFVFFNQWKMISKLKPILGLILFSLIVIPWYVLEQHAIPQFWNYFFVYQQFTRYLSHQFNCHQPIFFYIAIIVLGTFPWSLFFIQTLRFHIKKIYKDRKKQWISFFLLSWVILVTFFFSIPSSKIASYILPVFPSLALLFGSYWDYLWDQKKRRGLWITISCYLIIALFVFIILYHVSQFNVSVATLSSLLYVLSGIFIVGSFISWLSLKRKSLLILWSSLVATSALFLLTISIMISQFPFQSSQSMALYLKQHTKSDDTIISFLNYPYDLPFYLKHKIFIAADWKHLKNYQKDDWKRTFIVGNKFATSEHSRLMNLDVLKKQWNSKQRILVVIRSNKLSKFQSKISSHFLVTYRKASLLLLSNRTN